MTRLGKMIAIEATVLSILSSKAEIVSEIVKVGLTAVIPYLIPKAIVAAAPKSFATSLRLDRGDLSGDRFSGVIDISVKT